MGTAERDVIVVGGYNGLASAAYLAKGGLDVPGAFDDVVVRVRAMIERD